MQLHEAFQLVEALGVEEANQLIQQEGWKLLAITQRERVGSVYVLGKAKEKPSMKVSKDLLTRAARE
ncbi:hypothetical protein [Pseudomonas savastanoi]|uniref:hypothetical protein n=1 Tax=Pseudomonas savastanoi TaxID=29438 RepID=UPI00197DF9E8|nr:hypothetical protein [Pseudomonas savastanoi]MBN4178776.1 hypothetical protein [Pseudomonas savastanoi pv. phaseolicola]